MGTQGLRPHKSGLQVGPTPPHPEFLSFKGLARLTSVTMETNFFSRFQTYDLLSLSGLQALAPQADRRTQMAGLSHPQRLVGQLTVHLHSANIC